MPLQRAELFSITAETAEGSAAHGAALASGSAWASAELHRGIDLSAGVSVSANVSGEVGKQLSASLDAGVSGTVAIGLRAAIPLDLFSEAGLVARIQAQAEAAAYARIALSLSLDEFRELIGDALPAEPYGPLLDIVFEELRCEAALWARAAFAAEVLGEATLTGSLLPTAPGGAGFSASFRYAAGLGFGAGKGFTANIGIENPRRLLTRLADRVTDLAMDRVDLFVQGLPPDQASLARPAQAALRVLLPLASASAFQLGLDLADAPGPAQRQRAIDSVVDSFVRAAQEQLLRLVSDAAAAALGELLRSDQVLGALLHAGPETVDRAIELVGQLRDALEPLADASPADLDRWVPALTDALPVLHDLLATGLLPDSVADPGRILVARVWAAGALLERVLQWADDPSRGVADIFGAGAVPVPSAGLAAVVTDLLGHEPGAALGLADLVKVLTGADVEQWLREVLPEAGPVLDWVAAASATSAGQLVQVLLVDLAAPGGVDVDALFGHLAVAASHAVQTEVLPRLITPLRAAHPHDEALRLLLDELVVPGLVALPLVVLPRLPTLSSDPDAGRRLRESVSVVLLQSLQRFVLAATDVLLAHAMTEGETAIRSLAKEVERVDEASPVFAAVAMVGTGAILPMSVTPADVVALLDLAADAVHEFNDKEREPLLEVIGLVMAAGLTTGDTTQIATAVAAVAGTDDPPHKADLDQALSRVADGAWCIAEVVGPRLFELLLQHLVNQAKAVARLVHDAVETVVSAAIEAVHWLAERAAELAQLVVEIGQRIAATASRIAGDLAALAAHLRGLVDAAVDAVRAAGWSLVEPLIGWLPQEAQDAVHDVYDGLFDVVRALLELPLAVLGMAASWVHDALAAMVAAGSVDSSGVDAEVRRRIGDAAGQDVKLELKLTADTPVGEVTIVDLGAVTLPLASIRGAIADTVLGDPTYRQVVDGCVADARQQAADRAQQAVLQAQLDGTVGQQQATGDLVPGTPLAVQIVTPAPGSVHDGECRVEVRVTGANRSFVQETLGVPARVRVMLDGAVVSRPEHWHDVGGALVWRAAVRPVVPAAVESPPATLKPSVATTLKPSVATTLKPRLPLATLRTFTDVAAPVAMVEQAARSVPAARRTRSLTAATGRIHAEPLMKGHGAVYAGDFTLPRVRGVVERPALPGVLEAQGSGPGSGVLGPDGTVLLTGLQGVNSLQVLATDGAGQQASAGTAFVLAVRQPPSSDVRISAVTYDPVGPESQGEYVEVQAGPDAPVELTGWTLRDLARHVYTFPAFTLAPGARVRVWTGIGTNSGTDLYWGRRAAVWNNTGDHVVLSAPDGREVARVRYLPPERPRGRHR